MLVLSRKKRERIFIGDDIVITLLRVNETSCRLGIEAPRGVQVEREEVAIRRDEHLADGRLGTVTECSRCGSQMTDVHQAHECLPSNYVELQRVTDEDIAIEREARRLGIHPFELVHRRRKEAEQRQRDAQLSEFNERYGFES